MTVLVTGANGSVGSRVMSWLRNRGFKVRALVRRLDSLEEAAADEVAVGDITDAAAVRQAMVGSAYVVHCAAVPGPDLATSLRVNGEGTANLVEAALANRCQRFILVSTQSVYDKSAVGDVYEDAPLCSEGSPYQVGKVAAEHAVREGDGSGLVSYIHVDNLAHAIHLGLTSPQAVGQAYNTVDGYTTWRSYTDRFREWLGLGDLPRIEPAEAPASLAWQGRPRGDKLVRELGYTPQRSYAEAMEEIYARLRADGLAQ